MPNINWSSLTGTQIREVIRLWPDVPEYAQFKPVSKSQVVVQAAQKAKLPVTDVKVPEVKVQDLKGPPSTKRQKHFGADGEVKFLEHRQLYVGFFGGRVVVTKRTREACLDFLSNVHGVKLQG
jgi:hypothetical protein